MKTTYKYLKFTELPQQGKTKQWSVVNHTTIDFLGFIKWHGPWRQYCFMPASDCVFAPSCLVDIVNFIKQVMDDRKNKLKE